MNTLTEEKLKELESLLNKTLPKPWHVTISDTGGKWTGFPSIVAPEEVDKTIVHYGGFKQEHWQELSMKDAEMHANLMTSAVNSLPELISMARRTLEAEERLEKSVEISREALRLREQRDAWRSAAILGSQPEYDFQHDIDSPTNWKLAMDHAWNLDPEPRASLVRPKAIHPPQECAPPDGTDVPPDKDQVCAHGVPIGYVCPECDAEAMRKGLDDHSCNSTGWE